MRHVLSPALLLATILAAGCGSDPDDPAPGDCKPADRFAVWSDVDGDGFGDPDTESEACEMAGGLVLNGDDCDDASADVFPGNDELCDGLDNNCDQVADEGLNQIDVYPDADGDGAGELDSTPIQACAPPPGYAEEANDCDDTDGANFPGNTEVCDGGDNDCDNRVDDKDPDLDPGSLGTYYQDDDGDGFGDPDVARAACQLPPSGWATNADDCDDRRAGVNPTATEVCNGVDDNCDTLVDDDDPALDTSTWLTWYADTDGDTFGDPLVSTQSCARPADYTDNDQDCDDNDDQVRNPPAWRLDADADGFGAGAPLIQCDQPADHVLGNLPADCDDANAQVFPGQAEVCNTVDDDCDGLTDDQDPGLDIATADLYHPDMDGDGYGASNVDLYRCIQPPNAVVDASDCDDQRPWVNPLGVEVCDRLDNDCNGLRDDEDPGVDPADFTVWFPDTDGDGYGTLTGAVESCDPPPGFVDDGSDCDDTDDTFGPPPLWYGDADGDGFGDGLPLFGPSCTAPAGLAPDTAGFDCDDSTSAVSPVATEVCEDGIDNDCDGEDLVCPLPRSCAEYQGLDATSPDGVYTIEPIPYGPQFDVYCDMTTDGGGWTLVGSTRARPLSDEAIDWHPSLTTLEPGAQAPGVWDGLRNAFDGAPTDVRFACKLLTTDVDMAVDLSFYDVPWYDEFTTGADGQSCFSEGDGWGYDVVPARTDNLAGVSLLPGDDWNAGYLEGEDTCNDSDFTVDFDDRGVAGDPNDGTDWGFADGVFKCGTSGVGEAWFLFVREPAVD